MNVSVASMLLLWVGPSPAVVPDVPRPPAAFTLSWSGPPECGSASMIQARVEALLSGPPQGEGVAEIVGVVRRGGAQVELELSTTFEGAHDTRIMTAPSCEDLVEATAVLLSIALEPGLSDRSEPDRGVESVDDAGDSTPPAQLPPVPRPRGAPAVVDLSPAVDETTGRSERADLPESRRGGARLSLGAAGGLEYGALEGATGAVRISVGARGRSWSAEAVGTYLTPRRVQRDGVGGQHTLGTAGLRGCWYRGALGLGAELCGGIEAGGLRVDSDGLSPAVSTTGPFAGPAASIAGLWSWSRVALTVRAEGVAPIWTSRTRLRGEVLLEPFPVSFRVLGGVRVLFL